MVICFPGLEQAQHEEWSGPDRVEANGGKRKCQPQASTGPSPEASNPKLQNGAGALDSADALCVCDIYLGRISLLSPGPCNSVSNPPGLHSHALFNFNDQINVGLDRFYFASILLEGS